MNIWEAQEWVSMAGTEEGLARFDGIRFTVFDKQNTPAMTPAQVVVTWRGPVAF